MSQTMFRRIFSRIGFLQIGIILLVVLTALIHLQHGIAMGGGRGGPMAGGPGNFPGKSSTMLVGTPGTGNAPGAVGTPGTGNAPGAAGTPGIGNAPGAGQQGQRFSGGSGGGPAGGTSVLSSLPISLSVLFILNFIGYLVLGAALYMPLFQKIQRVVRWLLIVFAAVTIIAWFLIAGSHPDTLGIVDKVIEGALIVLLLIEEWQAIKSKSRGEPHMPAAGDPVQPLYSDTRY
jgi:hypothetical protein